MDKTLINRTVMLQAMMAGVARWEPFSRNPKRGEVCVGGVRYCVDLDRDGCPVLYALVRLQLKKAIASSDESISHR